MVDYKVCVLLSDALDEREEEDFRRFNLEPLDTTITVQAETFEEASEKARDYIAHELEKRGLRPEKGDKAKTVDGYDGERFVCEFYGFDWP